MNAPKPAELAGTYEDVSQLKGLSLKDISDRTEPMSILMCDPSHFEVKDTKNPFMEGNVGATDRTKAREQWEALRKTFKRLGCKVEVVPAARDLEDMVFTANQVLLGVGPDGTPYVVAAEMKYDSRRKEVPHFISWFDKHKYQIQRVPQENNEVIYFEGHGDALWHPGKQLLWGGYGHRSDARVYNHLSKSLNIPILLLKLVNPKFYHLDTAFCPLDEQTLLVFPGAFEQRGLEMIRHIFPRIIEVNENDANNFACNALPLGKNIVLQNGSSETCKQLTSMGFKPVEVDTTEFMKSGGSVSCLKMMIY